MPAPITLESLQKFVQVWLASTNIHEVHEHFPNLSTRSLYYWKEKAQTAFPNIILPHFTEKQLMQTGGNFEPLSIEGTILIGSDLHARPGVYSPAFQLFLEVAKKYKPTEIWLLGDIFDFPQISRHPRAGMDDKRPTLEDEFEWGNMQLRMIRKASPKSKRRRFWGNHDARFEMFLLQKSEMLEAIKGSTLKEQIAEYRNDWEEYHSVVVNERLIAGHRIHGGKHAAWNNVRDAGTDIMTGDTHRLVARPHTNFRGTYFGIETGFLGQKYGPQFRYTGTNPQDWQEGFVLAYINGSDIDYDLIYVKDNSCRVQGKRITL